MKTPSMIPVSRCKKPYSKLTDRQAESLVAPYLSRDGSGKRYAIRDILRSHYEDYAKAHPVPEYKDRIIRALMACGTGELGYTLRKCPDCGNIRMSADKCGCRYCPSCGYLRQLRWVEERKSELIEGIPYYHIVFTVPHELGSLIFQNQKVLLGTLFRSASQSVLQLSAEKKKMLPGIVMVLHTFGSTLVLHYHIHMLVSGGGLSLDKKEFLQPKSKGFFLPVRIMQARYRSLFLEEMKKLYADGKLEFFGDEQKYRNSYEWKELLDSCWKKDWNVEIKRYLSASREDGAANAAEHFSHYANRPAILPERIQPGSKAAEEKDPDVSNAVIYFSNYTDRSAITDNRIKSADDDTVSFEYKDYRDGGKKKIMDLQVEEFIRRFLLHILPPGVAKIRYAGFLSGCIKAKNLALIRSLLKQKAPDNPVKEMNARQLAAYFCGKDFSRCPVCGSEMGIYGVRLDIRHCASLVKSFKARAA